MMKTVIIFGCLMGLAVATPVGLKRNMPIMQEEVDPSVEEKTEIPMSSLNLPSNATSIRADITDGFSCENKTYGYYADVENDCQIFHVCLPVVYADGKENTFRWSFICPEETVFSQESFTCMRSEDMASDCAESFKYYELNRNFGAAMEESVEMAPAAEEDLSMMDNNMSRQPDQMPAATEIKEEKPVQVAIVAQKPEKKKDTIKTQMANRRKPSSGNKASESPMKKKTQPLRKVPAAAVLAAAVTTIKPAEEEINEPAVERTTVKYHRFTRRPEIVKDQKKEETKRPEMQIQIKKDLIKKRKPIVEAPVEVPVYTAAPQDIAIDIRADAPVVAESEVAIAAPVVLPQESKTRIAEPVPAVAQQTEVRDSEPMATEEVSVGVKKLALPIVEVPQKIEAAEPAPVVEAPVEEAAPVPELDDIDHHSMIVDFISSLVNGESEKLDDDEEKIEDLKPEPEVAAEITEPKLQEIPAPVQVVIAAETPAPAATPVRPFIPSFSDMLHIPVKVLAPGMEQPDPVQVAAPATDNVPMHEMPPLSIDDVIELVKESLDNPENEQQSQIATSAEEKKDLIAESDEVLPIYNRAPEDEPAKIPAGEEIAAPIQAAEPSNDDNEVQPDAVQSDDTAAVQKPAADEVELISAPKDESKTHEEEVVAKAEPVVAGVLPIAQAAEAEAAAAVVASKRSLMGRSLRAKMDPRKRRFLFRSDAS